MLAAPWYYIFIAYNVMFWEQLRKVISGKKGTRGRPYSEPVYYLLTKNLAGMANLCFEQFLCGERWGIIVLLAEIV